MNKLFFVQFARFLLLFLGVIGCYFLVKQTIIFWYPLIIAYCLTLICFPITQFLVKKLLLPNLLAAIISVGLIVSCLLFIMTWIILELFQSVTYLIDLMTEHFEVLLQSIKLFFDHNIWYVYKNYLTTTQQQIIEQKLQQFFGQLGDISVSLLQNIVFKMMKLLSVFPYSIMVLIFVLLATILLTKDWIHIKKYFRKFIPKPVNDSRLIVMDHFKSLFISYLQAQLIIVTITAVVLWIGLIFLQIKHAFSIVLMAAIVDLLPVVGTGLIFIPWIIYLFIIGQYALTIKLALLYGFVVLLRQLIEPKIISTKIGVHPLTVLMSLFLSLQIFGAVGLIVAPLIIIFGHALYQAKIHEQLWQFIKG